MATKGGKAKKPTKKQQCMEDLLMAAKHGLWPKYLTLLNGEANKRKVSHADFGQLPPGRSWSILHQVAFWGNEAILRATLTKHPFIDLQLRTAQGETIMQVASQQNLPGHAAFMTFLEERVATQQLHLLINAARDEEWDTFNELVAKEVPEDMVNSVPEPRIWGLIHQIAYAGSQAAFDALINEYDELDLELDTNEETVQTPVEISMGRGHTEFTKMLQDRITLTTGSAVVVPTSSMKVPVLAASKECQICLMDEHDEGAQGVACDNEHFMCETCFGTYVQSECDVKDNTANVLLNGGRVLCPCKESEGCDSKAFANKLIAMIVTDERYELYLKARDFVVGKEAAASALSKIKSAGAIDAVEQEEIRNLYRKPDGSYSTFMCGACKFGPIDHGWCNSLTTHHNDASAGHGEINNACPRCEWFAPSISDWLPWDGEFRDPAKKPKKKKAKHS